jgi:hypothetical protein
MKRTEVNFSTSFSNLEINEKSLFIGSCFADNIGQRFKSLHLDSTINPFGVVFHPIPLFKLIDRAINDDLFEIRDFFEFNDYWFNYQISGSCAKFQKIDAINFANQKLKELKLGLMSSNRLFLTFGSSILRKIKGEPVANCHKQPSELFEKQISSSYEIRSCLEPVLDQLFHINPSIKVSLSVSPIRHSKEGMAENSLSKSNLIILCNEICLAYKNVEYLPIYELVIDELRDYSFFNEDLIHPTKKTIEIVWERLKKNLGSQNFIQFCNISQQLLRSIKHEPLFPKSKQNFFFQKKLLSSIVEHERYYCVNWEEERKIVENRLKISA